MKQPSDSGPSEAISLRVFSMQYWQVWGMGLSFFPMSTYTIYRGISEPGRTVCICSPPLPPDVLFLPLSIQKWIEKLTPASRSYGSIYTTHVAGTGWHDTPIPCKPDKCDDRSWSTYIWVDPIFPLTYMNTALQTFVCASSTLVCSDNSGFSSKCSVNCTQLECDCVHPDELI